jgi:sugar lactone lactonase YvrE
MSTMEFKPVATGFCLLEAPRADERGVWFSEIVLGGIRCLRPDGRIDAWLIDRKLIGGIAINNDGAVLCSGTGGIVWVNPATDATGRLLEMIEGEPIGGINDMIPDSKGSLYFGTVDHPAMLSGENFYGRSALCRLDADGRVTELCGGHSFANGIGISPDGRRVYHNDSGVGTYVYELTPDDSLSKGVLLNKEADCDGIAVDREGGVWIAGIQSGEIRRVMPDGKVDRRVPVPGGHVTSLCFGGADLRDVYATTAAPGAGDAAMSGTVSAVRTAALYHARADVPGLPIGRTRFQLS